MSSGAGCRGKRGYETRREAQKAAEAVRRKGGGDGAALNTYHCGECGQYHYGRNPKRGRRPHIANDNTAKARRYWQLMRGEA